MQKLDMIDRLDHALIEIGTACLCLEEYSKDDLALMRNQIRKDLGFIFKDLHEIKKGLENE